MRTFILFGLYLLGSYKILVTSFQLVNANEHPSQSIGSFAAPPCSFANIEEPPACNSTRKLLNPRFTSCMLTEADLQHLIDLVNDAITAATSPPTYDKVRTSTRASSCPECTMNCTLKWFGSVTRSKNWREGPCEELFSEIESLLHTITRNILPLVPLALAVTQPGEYCAHIAKMEEDMRKLREDICNLEQYASQNLTGLLKQLEEQERCYLHQWSCAMCGVFEVEATLSTQRLSGLISLLQAGRLTDLSRELDFLKDERLLGPLIEGAYGKEYVEFISQFVDLLSDSRLSSHRLIVYNSSLTAILKAEHHTSNIVFLLKRMVDNEPEQNQEGLVVIKRRVDNYARKVMDDWVEGIRANNFHQIIEFGSPQIENRAGLSFLHVLPELVKKVIEGQDENQNVIANLFRFVTAFRWNIHKGVGLTELGKLLGKTEHKIQLALRVKDAFNGNLTGPDELAFREVTDMLNELKNGFPTVVRNLVWSPRCRISTNGMAISTGYISTGEDFIQRITTKVTGGTGPDWEFEPVWNEEKGEYFFRIRSSNGEYLGADFFWGTITTSPLDGLTATSSLEPCGDERYYGWKVEGVDDGTNQVRLFHMGRMLYLSGNTLVVSMKDGIGNTLSCA